MLKNHEKKNNNAILFVLLIVYLKKKKSKKTILQSLQTKFIQREIVISFSFFLFSFFFLSRLSVSDWKVSAVCLKLFTFSTSSNQLHSQPPKLPTTIVPPGSWTSVIYFLSDQKSKLLFCPLIGWDISNFFYSEATFFEGTRLAINVLLGVLKKCC